MDLSSLSREEKLALLDAMEEKERRFLQQREAFKPHGGQLRVIMSEALERYLFCGNGFGKSALLVNEVHWAATGYNPIKKEHTPVPAKIALVLDTPEKIEDFIAEYRKWHPLSEDQLHKRGKAHYSFISYDNGTTITVLTHEVTELKLEGSQWTHIFMDEPPPKPVFTAILRGGRIKGRPCKVFLAGTPVKAAWLRTDIHEKWVQGELPEAECFSGDTDENLANLEEGWFRRFFGKLSEKEQLIRRKGQFYDLDGLALAHLFSERTHVIPKAGWTWEEAAPCVVAMDPHTSKAHHAVLLGCDRENNLVIIAEYKEKGLARRFIRSLIEMGWFHSYRITDIVYDSAGNADMTSGEGTKSFGTVINEELARHGIGRARATTYDEKDDEAWVESIRDVLALPDEADNTDQRIPKLRFLQGTNGCISDVKNVQWAQDKNKDNKPKLDIGNKDFLACVKYALACHPRFDKPKKTAYYHSKPRYGINIAPKRARVVSLRRR